MALQFSVAVRNARLDAIETIIDTDAVLKIRTGEPPANCAAADTGTVLATLNLPSDWMAAASGGSKAKSGTWSDSSADASGTARHFRIYKSGGSVCHVQGLVVDTAVDGGDDMVMSNLILAAGQLLTVTSWVLNDGNV